MAAVRKKKYQASTDLQLGQLPAPMAERVISARRVQRAPAEYSGEAVFVFMGVCTGAIMGYGLSILLPIISPGLHARALLDGVRVAPGLTLIWAGIVGGLVLYYRVRAHDDGKLFHETQFEFDDRPEATRTVTKTIIYDFRSKQNFSTTDALPREVCVALANMFWLENNRRVSGRSLREHHVITDRNNNSQVREVILGLKRLGTWLNKDETELTDAAGLRLYFFLDEEAQRAYQQKWRDLCAAAGEDVELRIREGGTELVHGESDTTD
jgi:hypothetical protein